MIIDNKQRTAAPVQALLGRKLGMTQVWNADGRLVPLTVVQVGIDAVTRVRIEEVDGYGVVQLGFDGILACRVTKSMAGHSAKAGAESRRHLVEARTSAVGSHRSGQELQATMLEVGRAVDVSGNIKGKGFAGVMKRHGFAGVSASHGAHRNRHKPGSIGVCVTPGCIFKGLRVAGHMGNIRRTAQNLKIQAVDTEKGLLLISGAIPGPKNGMALTRSSAKGVWNV